VYTFPWSMSWSSISSHTFSLQPSSLLRTHCNLTSVFTTEISHIKVINNSHIITFLDSVFLSFLFAFNTTGTLPLWFVQVLLSSWVLFLKPYLFLSWSHQYSFPMLLNCVFGHSAKNSVLGLHYSPNAGFYLPLRFPSWAPRLYV
jgi:hypothetical protein